MAYSTADSVVLESGTTLATATITALIASADRRIDAILLEQGVTGTPGDIDLEVASVHLTIAKIIDLGRLTNERANSITLGGDLSLSNNTQNEIDYHERLADAAIMRYISRLTAGRRICVRKVNG